MYNDDLLFVEDEIDNTTPAPSTNHSPWKILIVDDDSEVHAVTKLVLSNFKWENIPLQFLSAYSASEAEQIFSQHNDIAVALIDVVMETDSAGLQLIKNIRNKFKNKTTRIVIRTGQPGQAPEREIIREYEITDYKNKTELSGLKLDTLLCSTLRAYQKIIALNKNQMGLELVIESSSILSNTLTYEALITETTKYLTRLVKQNSNNAMSALSSLGFYCNHNAFHVFDACGNLSKFERLTDVENIPDTASVLLSQSLAEQRHIYTDNQFVLNMQSKADSCILFKNWSKDSVKLFTYLVKPLKKNQKKRVIIFVVLLKLPAYWPWN